jgi:hypothetical protein
MAYTEKALRRHPGANPNRGVLEKRGQFWGWKNNARTGPMTVIDASRWIPHQSAREMSRGLRKLKNA